VAGRAGTETSVRPPATGVSKVTAARRGRQNRTRARQNVAWGGARERQRRSRPCRRAAARAGTETSVRPPTTDVSKVAAGRRGRHSHPWARQRAGGGDAATEAAAPGAAGGSTCGQAGGRAPGASTRAEPPITVIKIHNSGAERKTERPVRGGKRVVGGLRGAGGAARRGGGGAARGRQRWAARAQRGAGAARWAAGRWYGGVAAGSSVENWRVRQAANCCQGARKDGI